MRQSIGRSVADRSAKSRRFVSEFFRSDEVFGNAVTLEQRVGLEAFQAEGRREFVMSQIAQAVKLDHRRFLGDLVEVSPLAAKLLVDA